MKKHFQKTAMLVMCLGMLLLSAAGAWAVAFERSFEKPSPDQLELIQSSSLVSEEDLAYVRVVDLKSIIFFRIENEANCSDDVCRSFIYQPAAKDRFVAANLTGRLYFPDEMPPIYVPDSSSGEKYSPPAFPDVIFLHWDGRPQIGVDYNATEFELLVLEPDWFEKKHW